MIVSTGTLPTTALVDADLVESEVKILRSIPLSESTCRSQLVTFYLLAMS